MSGRFPIMRSLDPHHQRVGYLGALVLSTSRGLNTKESIHTRLENLLFERIYMDDPGLQAILEGLSSGRRAMLEKLRTKRTTENDPTAILEPTGKPSEWIHTCELWAHADCMPAPLGIVSPEKVDRVQDLGKWTGILVPTTFELSEAGYLLQILLEEEKEKAADGLSFNPLCPAPRSAVRLMYLRLLLGAEGLYTFIIKELIFLTDKGKIPRTYCEEGQDGLLTVAVDALIESLGDISDPDDMREIREITDFHNSLSGSVKTEENYLRPRMEQLVDLDLIRRDTSTSTRRGAFPWSVTSRTRKVAEAWADLGADQESIGEYLDKRFFSSMAYVYDVSLTPISDNRIILRWFAAAFERVGREFGFTPGRSVALFACLLAFEAGRLLEVEQVFNVVYDSAQSEWSQFLKFSGGSRFDREFMILVDLKFIAALDESLATTPEQS